MIPDMSGVRISLLVRADFIIAQTGRDVKAFAKKILPQQEQQSEQDHGLVQIPAVGAIVPFPQ